MGKIEELIKLLGQTKKLDVYQSDWENLVDLDHLLRRLVEMTEEEIGVRLG
ncbi:hypothetical protein BIZ89_gp164 [Bacillus phage Kida]|uniref:hypothetical protein n=1 Tax=Bacillus phage Kida TaxID=1873998 RepID=UPI0008111862|nr:hypothetical protein BIZ89_gp164 [Bacillus phage Kida]ANU79791.1 hypothetical protein KIDA_164 [Bacillus phage Kida]